MSKKMLVLDRSGGNEPREVVGSDAEPVLRIGSLGPQRWRSRARATFMVVATDIIALLAAVVVITLARAPSQGIAMISQSLPAILLLYLVTALRARAYSLNEMLDRRKTVSAGIRSTVFTFLLVSLLLFSLKLSYDYSRFGIFFVAVISGVLNASFRYFTWPSVFAMLTRHGLVQLVIGDGVTVPPISGAYVISAAQVGLVPDTSNLANVERLVAIAGEVDRIIVYCSEKRRQAWADTLKCLGKRGEIRLPEFDSIRPLSIEDNDGQVTMVLGQPPLEWHQALTKRVFDLLLCLLLAPVMVVIFTVVAIAIKLDSRGPVFFRQRRLGRDNKSFMLLKFRSMRVDMQDKDARTLTVRGDARVTRVGRFIRSTSIDELPQIINVLLGDMSIVGPRPHAPMALAGKRLYWEVDQRYWHRHVAKPGITGLAQVRGYRGNTLAESDLQLRLNADLEYLSEWSLYRDVEIIFATLRVIRHEHAF